MDQEAERRAEEESTDTDAAVTRRSSIRATRARATGPASGHGSRPDR